MWINTIYDLTPIELKGGMHFKRDDKFAPKGYGHINGSKLRQCLWLVDKWRKEKNIRGVVSGSVSQSPQHAFISEICKHYGIGCVIAYSKKNIDKSPYLKLAQENGAKLVYSKVGYAKTLGAISKKLLDVLPNHEFLETNITLEHSCNTWEDIEAFHLVGAEQVKNIPSDIKRIIIPCGSCNSVTSILYGLILYPKPNIKEVLLMGIGNHGSKNIGYIEHRLKNICAWKGISIDNKFDFKFKNDTTKEIVLKYHNLNGSGFCTYTDTMDEQIEDLVFHPRYEGKVIRFMRANLMKYWNKESLFWVVGSDINL